MKLRDLGQQFIYKIIDPFVRGMVKVGITPNFITTTGLILNIVAAAVFMVGGYHGERGDFSFVGWGGFLILFAGLFDMIDGRLARVGNMSSTYGALYDSVLDRYSELITLFGICYYLILQGFFISSMFAFVALIGSMMVSYVRARAEGLGIECKVGFMQRPERVILTGAGAMFCGIFYHFAGNYIVSVSFLPFPIFEPVLIFVLPIVIVAVFSNVTAIWRLLYCRNVLNQKDKEL